MPCPSILSHFVVVQCAFYCGLARLCMVWFRQIKYSRLVLGSSLRVLVRCVAALLYRFKYLLLLPQCRRQDAPGYFADLPG